VKWGIDWGLDWRAFRVDFRGKFGAFCFAVSVQKDYPLIFEKIRFYFVVFSTPIYRKIRIFWRF